MIKVVIFDLDDTLISEWDYIQSGYKVIAKTISEEYNFRFNQVYKMLISNFHIDSKNVFNRTLDDLKVFYNKDYIFFLIEKYRNHIPDIKFYDDVIPTLEELKRQGKRIGMITDGYKETQRNKINALNASKYFDYIIVTDELGREYWKPHEKSFIMMKEYFNVNSDEIIYVGDNLNKDFLAPIKLGMKWKHIIRMKSIYNKDTYCTDSIISLKQIIGEV